MEYKDIRKIINDKKNIPSEFKVILLGYLNYAENKNMSLQDTLNIINAAIEDTANEITST